MPGTVNGIGTKYYGELARASDNSYITTEWFVIFYVPIFPVGSFRVRPTGQSSNYIVYSSQQYEVQPVTLCRRQVISTYLVLAAVAAVFLPLWIFWGNESVLQTYAIVVVVTLIVGLIVSRRSNRRR